MRDKRKRRQREEVRKILAVMREELARQRLAYKDDPAKQPPTSLSQIIVQASAQARGSSGGQV